MILAILFSSPDDKPMTIQQWARADPGDFVATAVTELDGTSEIATYGPPYNNTPGAGQKVFGVTTQTLAGGALPDRHGTRTSSSIRCGASPATRRLRRALAAYEAAPPSLQNALDGRVHGGAREGPLPGRAARGCPPAATGRSPR